MAACKENARRRKAWICFQDESGFSLLPSVRATWAPKGKTPVLHHRFSWKRLSMSGAVGRRPRRVRRLAGVQHAPRGLQPGLAHRVLGGPARAPRRGQAPLDLGWAALASLQSDEGVD